MTSQKRPPLSAIVAMSENRVIGHHNQLPWHLPADLKHFKTITTGHPILMGRKTYESIGKPLPHRSNLILTHEATFKAPGAIVVHSLEAAFLKAHQLAATELFVIGGAQIYQQLLPAIQQIYLTLIHSRFEGDTYFPELAINEWDEIEREDHAPDDKNKYAYSFITLKRRLAI